MANFPKKPCGFRFCAAVTRIALSCESMSISQQSKIAGCIESGMYYRAEQLGIPWRFRVNAKSVSPTKLREAWARTDLSLSDAAALVGLKGQCFRKRAAKMGLPKRKCGARPVNLPDNLTSMWQSGVASEALAEKFGVAPSTIILEIKRRGLKNHTKAHRAITIAEWAERELAARMRATAAAEQRQMILAEMADCIGTVRPVGAEKGRAA